MRKKTNKAGAQAPKLIPISTAKFHLSGSEINALIKSALKQFVELYQKGLVTVEAAAYLATCEAMSELLYRVHTDTQTEEGKDMRKGEQNRSSRVVEQLLRLSNEGLLIGGAAAVTREEREEEEHREAEAGHQFNEEQDASGERRRGGFNE